MFFIIKFLHTSLKGIATTHSRTRNLVADLPLRRVLGNILKTVVLCVTLKPNGKFSGS